MNLLQVGRWNTWSQPAPLPKKEAEPGGGPPNFRPMSIVATQLDGSKWHLAPAPFPKRGRRPVPIFGPFLLWSNGCMDQDATWYGGRPQPRGLCVIWEPSPLNFRLMFIIVIVISLEHCTKRSRYWFIQVQVQVLYSMHSIFRIV